MRVVNRTLDKQTIDLDFNHFEKCTFNECEMIFHGHAPVTMSGCTFNTCKWSFSGPAALTLAFMQATYQVPGMSGVLEATFQNIRSGTTPPRTP